MPSSMLFAVNNEGRIFGLSTNGTKWREFQYLGLEFKQLSAVSHFLWAVGSDRQIYVHAHGLDIPIRIKEEAYENQRWVPIDGFGKRMLPTDRYRWSCKDGTTERQLNQIRLPSMAWQWEGDWHIETTLDGQPLDDDGWTYAVDFPTTYYSQKQWSSCVRRRKWVRYRRYAAINTWCAIAPLHKDPTQEPFIDVSIGGQNEPGNDASSMQVWAVTAQGRVMWRSGVSTTAPEGMRWNAVTVPPGCEVKNISCGAAGLVWAVLWNGKALVRVGISRTCPTGEYWIEVAAPEENLKLIQVSVGTNSVWAVSNDHRVWFRKGVRGSCGTEGRSSDELARGSGWVEMVGDMALVSVAPNDQVFAVGLEDRVVYYRAGVSNAELTGRRWRSLHAPTQLSRASSNASLCYRTSLRNKKHKSTNSLHRNSFTAMETSDYNEETSRSAPTSLRIQSQSWNKSVDNSWNHSRASSESGIVEQPILENSQSEVDLSRRSVRAWSPVRSVGSLLGMEADPNTDPDSVLDPDLERDVFRERDDIDPAEPVWEQADTVWVCVEAGAVSVDPSILPNWFHEGVSGGQFEIAPWRSKVLGDLKQRQTKETSGFENYEIAVEMASWIKSSECRCCLSGSSSYDDCIVELEWVGNQSGSLDSGTLSVLSLDKSHTKAQMALSEIVAVIEVSEPGCPRLAIHTVHSTVTNTFPLRLQFSGDIDLDDWTANLTSVCCQMNLLEGAPSESSLWTTTRLGDVFNFDLNSFKASQQKEKHLFCKELDLKGNNEWLLSNGFGPGSKLSITGTVRDNVERFNIDLQSQSSQNPGDKGIAFHFNPRFKDGVLVRNTQTAGVWEKEEREGVLTLSVGVDFSLDIICQENDYKVLVNGLVCTSYEHRHKPQSVTHLAISEQVQLNKILYYSKNVIIPLPEMFWRQMGGHLEQVETCSTSITWGIGADKTPWAYSGGWGGAVLGGLERSMAGIFPMTDAHCCYVYENQRWNPLSGFTSKGLPTDRPMWSDSTGKKRRSKETTRLLSMHWQWVGDWAVDYNTPGGVNKQGWQYAVDFPCNYHAKKSLTDYVRRRRWIRKCRLTTSGPWLEVGNSKICDVSLNSIAGTSYTCVWAVGANGDALYRKGVRRENPLGDIWEHVPCDQSLCSISCGPNNQVWAVAKNGSTYWRFGITGSNPMGEVWETVEPPNGPTVKQVSIGKWAVWALNNEGKLFVRKEVTSVFPEGTHWQAVTDNLSDGGFRHVSAGNHEVWAVSSAGVICRRIGVTCENPAGVMWQAALAGNWQYISARGFLDLNHTR